MTSDGENDLLRVPCYALGSVSLSKLSSRLNVEHVLPGKGGHCRDWRVLAELVLPHDRVEFLRRADDCLSETLKAWPREATVDQLIKALEAVERFDVIDDCKEAMISDCRDFARRRDAWGSEPSFLHGCNFEAFIVHAHNDIDFVKELVERVEMKGFPLFVPARDLPAATTDYLYKLMQIMENRCRKVIIVISRALQTDEDAKALLETAQILQAQRRSQATVKVIPVVIEDCPIVGSLLVNLSSVSFKANPEWAWRNLMLALGT